MSESPLSPPIEYLNALKLRNESFSQYKHTIQTAELNEEETLELESSLQGHFRVKNTKNSGMAVFIRQFKADTFKAAFREQHS